MAYNVVKGSVEGSVDQHADQEIDGIKIFKNTISASVFYDTDAQSPCATMKDVAIKKIVGKSTGALITYAKDGIATTSDNLTFDGATLSAKNVSAGTFEGNAAGLTGIPSDRFSEKISGEQLQVGAGLHSVGGKLQVDTHSGLSVDSDGISISLSALGGLSIQNSKLVVDPGKTESITAQGQNLSDKDLIMVSDISHNKLRHTSLGNLYSNYIKDKIPHAAGSTNDIQIKGKSGFSSTPKFAYDMSTHTLKVEGKILATTLKIDGDMQCDGAVINNIKTITSRIYEVQASDYALLCDTESCPITVMLPPACNHAGRLLSFKSIGNSGNKKNQYPVLLKTTEGRIDTESEIMIKTKHSLRTIQSDGKNWWIVGAQGN